MQTLITLGIVSSFILPALFISNFSAIKLDRYLVLRVFAVFLIVYLGMGCLLHLFPQLVDPR